MKYLNFIVLVFIAAMLVMLVRNMPTSFAHTDTVTNTNTNTIKEVRVEQTVAGGLPKGPEKSEEKIEEKKDADKDGYPVSDDGSITGCTIIRPYKVEIAVVTPANDQEAEEIRNEAQTCMLECRHRNSCIMSGGIDVNGTCVCLVKGDRYNNDNDESNRFVRPEELVEQKKDDND